MKGKRQSPGNAPWSDSRLFVSGKGSDEEGGEVDRRKKRRGRKSPSPELDEEGNVIVKAAGSKKRAAPRYVPRKGDSFYRLWNIS